MNADKGVQKKKRARKSESPDSDGEKRRGRPRVDKQDASAADVSNVRFHIQTAKFVPSIVRESDESRI